MFNDYEKEIDATSLWCSCIGASKLRVVLKKSYLTDQGRTTKCASVAIILRISECFTLYTFRMSKQHANITMKELSLTKAKVSMN